MCAKHGLAYPGEVNAKGSCCGNAELTKGALERVQTPLSSDRGFEVEKLRVMGMLSKASQCDHAKYSGPFRRLKAAQSDDFGI